MKKIGALLTILLTIIYSNLSHANLIVEPGYDLLQTVVPTNFQGFDFMGVPLEVFDFGGGPQSVGDNADTIVQRIDQAAVGAPGQTDIITIELVALQLVSTAPIDLGAGIGFHYITLNSTPSMGQMSITFDNMDGGTFDSFIDVSFDIRIGDIDGVIINSQNLRLSSTGTDWDRTPPAGAVLIEGVNRFLVGPGDPAHDFWPGSDFGPGISEIHPSGAMHTAKTATVSSIPEPATLAIFGLGLAGLGLLRRRVV